jgi:hypothetical protein
MLSRASVILASLSVLLGYLVSRHKVAIGVVKAA